MDSWKYSSLLGNGGVDDENKMYLVNETMAYVPCGLAFQAMKTSLEFRPVLDCGSHRALLLVTCLLLAPLELIGASAAPIRYAGQESELVVSEVSEHRRLGAEWNSAASAWQ